MYKLVNTKEIYGFKIEVYSKENLYSFTISMGGRLLMEKQDIQKEALDKELNLAIRKMRRTPFSFFDYTVEQLEEIINKKYVFPALTFQWNNGVPVGVREYLLYGNTMEEIEEMRERIEFASKN